MAPRCFGGGKVIEFSLVTNVTEDGAAQKVSSLTPKCSESDAWNKCYVSECEIELKAATCVWLRITTECDEAWYLDKSRRLQRLTYATELPTPVGCFLVVRRGSDWRKIEVPWAARLQAEHVGRRSTLTATILDKRGCGLFRVGPSWNVGQRQVLHAPV
jgi:hypothetical protein